MAELKDPKRLVESEGTPPVLRSWLERAREDALSPAQLAELVQQVERLDAAPRRREHRLDERPPLSKGVLAGKGLLLLSGLGIGLIALWFKVRSPTSTASMSAVSTTQFSAKPASAAEAPPPATVSVPKGAEPVASATEPVASATAGAVSGSTALRAAAKSSASGVAAPPAPTVAPRSTDEFQLLRAARESVASAPARSLALTAEHARLFPNGMLAQEREAIAIDSLLRLGRHAEAEARARRFLARFPTSPYASRIENSLRARRP
jgi:hypothetical protein